jgi:phage terminase large subunit-like protein
MNVVTWAEADWRLETGELIRLRPWQKAVLLAMFPPDGSPSPWETFLISTVKKGGKTELNAIATAYAALTFPAPETAYCVANDAEQAEQRVFERIARAVRAMGLVKAGAAVVSKSEVFFTETGSKIVAIPADFAGAAGALFGITSWTELWAYRFEAHTRLWEELTPVPHRRSLRIVDSYAGFSGDAAVLEPMWRRALEGERLDGELPIYANGKLWAYIDTGEDAQRRAWLGEPGEMQAYYREQAASLRPGTFRRLHLNEWQAGEEAFLTADQWDECVDVELRPMLPDPKTRVYVGVDAAQKRDSTAVVVVARIEDRLQLVGHRVWTPSKGQPLDFSETLEPYLAELVDGFKVETILYDPRMLEQAGPDW